MEHNVYLPRLARITHIKEEVQGERAVKTFPTVMLEGESFTPRCGQCAMLSVFGRGESMISISSSPLVTDYLQFSVMKTGRVTSVLHDMEEGGLIGIRGPYGNGFPLEAWAGKNIIFVGGGIGLAPIWSVLQTTPLQRGTYGRLTVFYGARTSDLIIYREELA